MYNVHVIKLQHVVNLMFLPWQNVHKYQCKELYLGHKKGYSAEKNWLFKVKNRLLKQHLGGPLIPNPQLSQLAVEGHVPSNLVSQFQQLRKGVFWDILYITTMCNMPATEKHNPQHTFTCSQHRRLLGVQRSNVVRFMSLCFALAIGIHKAALAQGHYI